VPWPWTYGLENPILFSMESESDGVTRNGELHDTTVAKRTSARLKPHLLTSKWASLDLLLLRCALHWSQGLSLSSLPITRVLASALTRCV
jgi:hypothetical protein